MGAWNYTAAGEAYGTDPELLHRIAVAESGENPNAINDWDSNAKRGTPSEGIVQFIKPTFDAYARQAMQANPAAWQGVSPDWHNPQAQLLAASWAIKNGKGSAWSTYQKALAQTNGRVSAHNQRQRVGLVAAAPSKPQYGLSSSVLDSLFGDDAALRQIMGRLASIPTPTAPTAPALPSGGGFRGERFDAPKGAPGRQKGEAGWHYLQRVGESLFGLRNDPGDTQTTGGHHTKNSEHYRGRAIDFGTARNSPQQLAQWVAWAKAHGFDVLNEGDHIHVSLPGRGV